MKDKQWAEIQERLNLYTYNELEILETLIKGTKKLKYDEYREESNKKYMKNYENRKKTKERLESEVYPKIKEFAIKMPIGTVYKVKQGYRRLIEVRGDYLFGNTGWFNKDKWIDSSYSAENQAQLVEKAYIKGKWITKKDILNLKK